MLSIRIQHQIPDSLPSGGPMFASLTWSTLIELLPMTRVKPGLMIQVLCRSPWNAPGITAFACITTHMPAAASRTIDQAAQPDAESVRQDWPTQADSHTMCMAYVQLHLQPLSVTPSQQSMTLLGFVALHAPEAEQQLGTHIPQPLAYPSDSLLSLVQKQLPPL